MPSKLTLAIGFAMVFLTTTLPASAASTLTSADRHRLQSILRQTDSDLRGDVLPFWTRATWDDKHGGFFTDVDRKGNPKPGSDKYTIMNARMIWTLAAAHAYGIHNRGYLQLAGKAVKYLTSHIWDPVYGGFYMSVKPDGAPDDDRKFTYCQEFVVYGLSEYAMVSGDRDALQWAEKTYDFLNSKARDPLLPSPARGTSESGRGAGGEGFLGFREDFDRQWRPLPDSLGVGGVKSGKTLNTHMHMMEALTALVDASHNARYRTDLAQITDLLLARVINRQYGCAMEPFDRKWHPVPDAKGRMSTFYGHNVELAWLLLDAYRALGRDREQIRPIFCGLLDNALKYGIDTARGGIAGIGPYNQPVTGDPRYASDIVNKEWWEQAESLTAFAEAFEWTHDRRYLDALEKQWEWVWNHQIDHEDGDWFSEVNWSTGTPSTLDKGLGGWKAAYHNGRALMRASTAIRSILTAK